MPSRMRLSDIGEKSDTTPAAMKHSPMTGTILTENAPPATTAVPYRRSQTPGITSTSPALYKTSVNRAPTIIGGEKLRTNFRPGPERRGIFAERALRTIAHIMMVGDRSAEASQMLSAPVAVFWSDATIATTIASTPIATIPQPDTAV